MFAISVFIVFWASILTLLIFALKCVFETIEELFNSALDIIMYAAVALVGSLLLLIAGTLIFALMEGKFFSQLSSIIFIVVVIAFCAGVILLLLNSNIVYRILYIISRAVDFLCPILDTGFNRCMSIIEKRTEKIHTEFVKTRILDDSTQNQG